MPITTRLKSASSASHRSAEQHSFLRNLACGTLTPRSYLSYLWELYFTYRALEKNLRYIPLLNALAGRYQLHRTQAIEADISYFENRLNVSVRNPSPISRYTHHLEKTAEAWPNGLIAHFYTRYLGDLSGGQILGRFVRNTFSLDSNQGNAFYRFNSIESPRNTVLEIKQALDSISLDSPEMTQLEIECITAFQLSESLFEAALQDRPMEPSDQTRLSSLS